MDRQAILRALRERILLFAASKLMKDAAEDLAQEVLMVIEKKYAHLDRIEDLLPVSLQITRFKILAARRKIYRRGEHTQVQVEDAQLADPAATPETIAAQRILVERLRKAIARLGDRCRDLMKYKLQGSTFAEIQQRMGAKSINTVYTWDLRCRQNLLDLMGGDWE